MHFQQGQERGKIVCTVAINELKEMNLLTEEMRRRHPKKIRKEGKRILLIVTRKFSLPISQPFEMWNKSQNHK